MAGVQPLPPLQFRLDGRRKAPKLVRMGAVPSTSGASAGARPQRRALSGQPAFASISMASSHAGSGQATGTGACMGTPLAECAAGAIRSTRGRPCGHGTPPPPQTHTSARLTCAPPACPAVSLQAMPLFLVASAAEAAPAALPAGVASWQIMMSNLLAGATAGCAVEAGEGAGGSGCAGAVLCAQGHSDTGAGLAVPNGQHGGARGLPGRTERPIPPSGVVPTCCPAPGAPHCSAVPHRHHQDPVASHDWRWRLEGAAAARRRQGPVCR